MGFALEHSCLTKKLLLLAKTLEEDQVGEAREGEAWEMSKTGGT